jgi:3-deoxy-D-manno-octulosonic-acid transferase
MKERVKFEKRNKFEWLAHSFREIHQTADFCFEFSSEGEYQQAAPLIDDALKAGKRIELVFFSPSVEKTIMKLAANHSQQVRYLRYPLVRMFPFVERRCFTSWITAKTLIMVRYDLFPEFLLWSLKPEHSLFLIWMTFKKERSQGRGPGFWKKLFLKSAQKIVYAGSPDAQEGLLMDFPGETFDYRQEQIRRRVELREEKFLSHFLLYSELRRQLAAVKTKIILGNAWPSDLFLLRDLADDDLVVIVPHELSQANLDLFRQGLRSLGRDVFELNDHSTSWQSASAVLVNKKGILCELYADFSHAYVGGGFERSIHSVLEPFIAGSKHIACGPLHHRSTEYDIVLGEGFITEVNTPEQFLMWLNSSAKADPHDKMKPTRYQFMREFVISC